MNQSITFAMVAVTGDLSSNLIKSILDKNPMKLAKMPIANSKQVSF